MKKQVASDFAVRLRYALESAGYRPSPTLVAHEFNQRYWGKSITVHTARSWLMGISLPMQDKLLVLAEWLQVSPHELRYGPQVTGTLPVANDQNGGLENISLQDREMIRRYLLLSADGRKTVRDVVEALECKARLTGR